MSAAKCRLFWPGVGVVTARMFLFWRNHSYQISSFICCWNCPPQQIKMLHSCISAIMCRKAGANYGYLSWNQCPCMAFVNDNHLLKGGKNLCDMHALSQSSVVSLIARFMGPTWGLSGADRTQVGPMLAPWTLLSGLYLQSNLVLATTVAFVIPFGSFQPI